MKTQLIRRLLLCLLLVVIALVVLGVAGGRLLRTEVSVASVERGTAVQAVPGVVRIAAERTVELRSEPGGRVAVSAMEVGARVAAGEILVRLDDSELRRALERVRVDLEAEEALRRIGSLLRHDLEEAREELARKEELHAEGQFSRRELDLQRRRLARLEDEIQLEKIREQRRIGLLKNEETRLEAELEKMVIRAPVGGDLVEVLAHEGDLIAPRGPVARLLSQGRVIEANLSEENFAGIEPGQSARVRFLSYGSRLFPATVAKVLPAANPETQRYTVHLEVDMPEEMKTPGLTGEVSIVLGERENSLVIPRRALVGREVFVVREGGEVALRKVDIGFVSLNHVEILSGLQAGERVALENLDRLRDGDRVRLKVGR